MGFSCGDEGSWVYKHFVLGTSSTNGDRYSEQVAQCRAPQAQNSTPFGIGLRQRQQKKNPGSCIGGVALSSAVGGGNGGAGAWSNKFVPAVSLFGFLPGKDSGDGSTGRSGWPRNAGIEFMLTSREDQPPDNAGNHMP
jgi:hypothetical protein